MKSSEITESHDQYISMWKVLAGDRPGADLSDAPGLSMCWGNSAFAFWNAIFLTEHFSDADQLRQRLNESAAYMRRVSEGGLVYVCEDFLSEPLKQQIYEIATSAELKFALDITGMVGDILPLDNPIHAPTLKLVRVTDEVTLQHFADINSEAYDMALEAGRSGLSGSRFWKETAHAYVGYENGKAVSAAAAIVNNGQIYLALVATRPDAQRKGFSRATVQHALNLAYQATGIKRTTLHATDDGYPVYKQLGYHRTAKFITFSLA